MIAFLNDLLWSKMLVYVLIPVGLLFTIASGFVQIRHFGRMWGIFSQAFRHKTAQPTSFQALALSVAGRVGAGNIAGVAVALALGGPGAIFWMWLVGLVGMATSYFECALGQLYKRREPNGAFRGGPAFYIKHGLRKRLGAGAIGLAGLYSALLFVTFGCAFVVLQSFALTNSVESAFGAPRLATGLALAALIGVVIFGGVKRIANVVEFVVPLMAAGYIIMMLIVLALNAGEIPGALWTIVASAVGLEEAAGGAIGAAITNGVRRGLFSNEAGLGSAPNVAAVAYVPHPAQQGIVQALSVFIDTIIICSCTASIIILSGLDANDPNIDGVVLTQLSLAEHVGPWAEQFVALALALFVFSSIMYNYFLGETAIDFFTSYSPLAFNIYRAVALALVMAGASVDLGAAFGFADVTMGVLALVNLFALVLLFPTGLRIMRDFDRQLKDGREPVFDPDRFADLDIDREAWTLEEEDAARLAALRATKRG